MSNKISFINTNPVKISTMPREIEAIEESGIYSNYGPVNQTFEHRIISDLFDNIGGCVTSCNATIGLMLAIKEATYSAKRRGRYALMPSFTFAATAHAAIWAGFTPLLCDIEPQTWALDADKEDEILRKYGDEIAIIVPYATFGTNINLKRYDEIYSRRGIPVVVDAAASLGSLNSNNKTFGHGFSQSIVYSMHVTKTFSTYEGGLIYSSDQDRIRRLRAMGNFGFEVPRTASLPGLNSKLTEVGALAALKKLEKFESIVEIREQKAMLYKHFLQEFEFQKHTGTRTAYQFMPVLLKQDLVCKRQSIIDKMASQGIMTASYFSPHLAEQPYFAEMCAMASLPITEDVSNRIISLPLYESLTEENINDVCRILKEIIEGL